MRAKLRRAFLGALACVFLVAASAPDGPAKVWYSTVVKDGTRYKVSHTLNEKGQEVSTPFAMQVGRDWQYLRKDAPSNNLVHRLSDGTQVFVNVRSHGGKSVATVEQIMRKGKTWEKVDDANREEVRNRVGKETVQWANPTDGHRYLFQFDPGNAENAVRAKPTFISESEVFKRGAQGPTERRGFWAPTTVALMPGSRHEEISTYEEDRGRFDKKRSKDLEELLSKGKKNPAVQERLRNAAMGNKTAAQSIFEASLLNHTGDLKKEQAHSGEDLLSGDAKRKVEIAGLKLRATLPEVVQSSHFDKHAITYFMVPDDTDRVSEIEKGLKDFGTAYGLFRLQALGGELVDQNIPIAGGVSQLIRASKDAMQITHMKTAVVLDASKGLEEGLARYLRETDPKILARVVAAVGSLDPKAEKGSRLTGVPLIGGFAVRELNKAGNGQVLNGARNAMDDATLVAKMMVSGELKQNLALVEKELGQTSEEFFPIRLFLSQVHPLLAATPEEQKRILERAGRSRSFISFPLSDENMKPFPDGKEQYFSLRIGDGYPAIYKAAIFDELVKYKEGKGLNAANAEKAIVTGIKKTWRVSEKAAKTIWKDFQKLNEEDAKSVETVITRERVTAIVNKQRMFANQDRALWEEPSQALVKHNDAMKTKVLLKGVSLIGKMNAHSADAAKTEKREPSGEVMGPQPRPVEASVRPEAPTQTSAEEASEAPELPQETPAEDSAN